jgi:hypothetical protein
VWGVTWANVQLMMSDAIRFDYKTDKEQEDEVMDLNDPKMISKLKMMAGG